MARVCVTGFANRGLIDTSSFWTLSTYNAVCGKSTALKFGDTTSLSFHALSELQIECMYI